MVIAHGLNSCLECGEVPKWMVKGQIALIQKDVKKGRTASNYRPITCLPVSWKLLTGILAAGKGAGKETMYGNGVD